jgi:large subunit ribosomal protein L17
MFRNMVTSLFKHERIKTTETKAKELRRWADHLVTLAKRGDLHARRQALAIVREKQVVHKLFEEAQERFGGVNGGYTRIVKIGFRPGDAAKMTMIELVTPEGQPKKKKKKKKASALPKTAPSAAPETEATSPRAAEEAVQPQTDAAADGDKPKSAIENENQTTTPEAVDAASVAEEPKTIEDAEPDLDKSSQEKKNDPA